MWNFIITRDFHDVRLDRFIRKRYREIVLTSIFRLIRKGRVRVNGKRKKPDYRLQENDTVHVKFIIFQPEEDRKAWRQRAEQYLQRPKPIAIN